VPAVFKLLKDMGDLSDGQLYNTFNMGIGMALAVPTDQADAVARAAAALGQPASIIGEVVAGESGLELC
jgi:phosphoribosylformylglycinamidine cyclo-ligase